MPSSSFDRRVGERTIEVADFFEGAFTTALAEDDLLTEIRLPAPSGGMGSAYQALEQRASGYAIAGVAAVVGRAGSGAGDGPVRGTDARRGTSSGSRSPAWATVPTARRRPRLPSPARTATTRAGGGLARVTDGVAVGGDIHADAEYRTAMTREMARRAIELARARLG